MIIVFAELCVEEVNGYLAEIIIMSINLWFDYMSVCNYGDNIFL